MNVLPTAFGISAIALALISAPAEARAKKAKWEIGKRIYAVAADNARYQSASLDFAPLPGAARKIDVPAGTAIIATFSAECAIFGSTSIHLNWVELQIRDNDRPIHDGPLALCADGGSTSHSLEVATRLEPGRHNIEVFWKIRKGNSDSLQALLDNWELTIQRAEGASLQAP